MTKKRIIAIVVVGIANLIISTILIMSIPTVMHRLTNHKVQKPDPQVTYCEFPFELTYMLDGQIITISDVYVCEYVGSYWNWNIGYYREWNGYIRSTNAENIVLIQDGNKEIVCKVGYPEYCMGDIKEGVTYPDYPVLTLVEHIDGGIRELHVSDELKAQYNVDLISWDLPDPIVNSFE